MNARLLGLAMVVGLSLPVAAQAQMLAPGLWELTTSNMKVDNQDLPDLSLILGQLQATDDPANSARCWRSRASPWPAKACRCA